MPLHVQILYFSLIIFKDIKVAVPQRPKYRLFHWSLIIKICNILYKKKKTINIWRLNLAFPNKVLFRLLMEVSIDLM